MASSEKKHNAIITVTAPKNYNVGLHFLYNIKWKEQSTKSIENLF